MSRAELRFVTESRRLAKGCPVVTGLRARHGAPTFPAIRGTAFEALSRSVAYQQLAGAAAATIWGRFRRACDNKVTPARVLALPSEQARAAGLSNSKWTAIRGLAEAVDEGRVKLRGLRSREEAEIIEHLTQVKGIGPWTANMFCMFHLRRLDVWPTLDYGVRKGFATAWQLPEIPSAKALAPLADAYRPYRSLLAWYCWRAADDVTAS